MIKILKKIEIKFLKKFKNYRFKKIDIKNYKNLEKVFKKINLNAL